MKAPQQIMEDAPDKQGRWPRHVIEKDLALCYAKGSTFSNEMIGRAREASRGIKDAAKRRAYIQGRALDFEERLPMIPRWKDCQ